VPAFRGLIQRVLIPAPLFTSEQNGDDDNGNDQDADQDNPVAIPCLRDERGRSWFDFFRRGSGHLRKTRGGGRADNFARRAGGVKQNLPARNQRCTG